MSKAQLVALVLKRAETMTPAEKRRLILELRAGAGTGAWADVGARRLWLN